MMSGCKRLLLPGMFALCACGGRGPVTASDMVAVAADRQDAPDTFSDVVQALEHNTCAVRRVVALREAVFGTLEERELAEVDALARGLCDVGVRQVDVQIGADGLVSLVSPASGVVAAGPNLVLFDTFEEQTIVPSLVASDERMDGEPACGVAMPSEPTASVLVVGPGARVAIEGGEELRVRLRSEATHEDSCASAGESVVLSEGVAHIWVGQVSEPSWQLAVTPSGRDGFGGVREWNGSVEITQELTVGPYMQPADAQELYCSGYIDETPTQSLHVPEAREGSIRVISDHDPVLVARGPNGEVYCNDDYEGLNPALYEWFAEGRWDIWVGTFSANRSFEASVILY